MTRLSPAFLSCLGVVLLSQSPDVLYASRVIITSAFNSNGLVTSSADALEEQANDASVVQEHNSKMDRAVSHHEHGMQIDWEEKIKAFCQQKNAATLGELALKISQDPLGHKEGTKMVYVDGAEAQVTSFVDQVQAANVMELFISALQTDSNSVLTVLENTALGKGPRTYWGPLLPALLQNLAATNSGQMATRIVKAIHQVILNNEENREAYFKQEQMGTLVGLLKKKFSEDQDSTFIEELLNAITDIMFEAKARSVTGTDSGNKSNHRKVWLVKENGLEAVATLLGDATLPEPTRTAAEKLVTAVCTRTEDKWHWLTSDEGLKAHVPAVFPLLKGAGAISKAKWFK